jgi:hypothetical protein
MTSRSCSALAISSIPPPAHVRKSGAVEEGEGAARDLLDRIPAPQSYAPGPRSIE